jgi:hypothetical protein
MDIKKEIPEGLLYLQPTINQEIVSIFGHHRKLLVSPDYKKIRDNFAKELRAASKNKKSSLSYLQHHIPDKPLIYSGLAQGIVIGGTHYVSTLEQISPGGKRKVLIKKRGRTPILTDENVLAKFINEHFFPEAEAIGVNMAFPLKPVKGSFAEIDGTLEYGTKEHTLNGLEGKAIGAWIKTIIQKNIPVAVANDAICLTMLCKKEEAGSFIAATGVNMSIKENEKIAVNLESGNFNVFKSDVILEEIDAISQNRGKNRYEKKAGGKYLPLEFNKTAEYLGLGMSVPRVMKTLELSELAHQTESTVARELARVILARSASMVAAQLAGYYFYKGYPSYFGLIGEGSLLWKGWNYIDNLKRRLALLDVPIETVTIRKVADSSIKGAITLLTHE